VPLEKDANTAFMVRWRSYYDASASPDDE